MKCRDCSFMIEEPNLAEAFQKVRIDGSDFVAKVDVSHYEGFCKRWNEKSLLDSNACRFGVREDSQ